MMNEKVISIESVPRPESREPCGACHRPLSKKQHEWPGKDGETIYLICSRCYDFLHLSAGEKVLYMERVRNET